MPSDPRPGTRDDDGNPSEFGSCQLHGREIARPVAAVVMAAGQGKRLKSSRAKVLHVAAGRALIDHVLAALVATAASPVVVVTGHLRHQLENHLRGRDVVLAVQDPPRGTGDAVRCALPRLPASGTVLVVSGDTPLLRGTSLCGVLEVMRRDRAAAVVATAVLEDGGAYGRILRDAAGAVRTIVEAGDATADELAVREVNAGAYVFDIAALTTSLATLTTDNVQGEYYLTDAIEHLVRSGARVLACTLGDRDEMLGVNTREELAQVHGTLNQRILHRIAADGVTILDFASTWVDADCELGVDVVLEPGTHLRGRCVIGDCCHIGANAVLTDVVLAPGSRVPPLTARSGSSA